MIQEPVRFSMEDLTPEEVFLAKRVQARPAPSALFHGNYKYLLAMPSATGGPSKDLLVRTFLASKHMISRTVHVEILGPHLTHWKLSNNCTRSVLVR